MPHVAAHVTDTELELLKLLWDRGPSTIRDLTDALYPQGGTSHYATVQKLLGRLESKAFVKRRQDRRVNVYSAVVQRRELISRRLQETADKLCEGSLTPLLTHLVRSRRLSKDDLSTLRDLVDQLDTQSSRRGRS